MEREKKLLMELLLYIVTYIKVNKIINNFLFYLKDEI